MVEKKKRDKYIYGYIYMKVNNHKAYIVKRSILVTLDTYNKFNEDVYKIPFMGNDKRKSPAYYRDIKSFLIHLICNCYLYSKNSNNKRYTRYSPFPSKLGKEKLPQVFKQKKYLGYDRALELLEKSGIIRIKSYNHGNHLCRQFALSKMHLKKWFGISKKSYMNREERFIHLNASKIGINRHIWTQKKLINEITRGRKKTKHSIRHVSRNTMNYMSSVYNDMGLLLVNVDKLFSFKPRSNIEQLHKTMLIQHLIDRGSEVINDRPLVVGYSPEYKVANIGTRSFEKGGGFQFLKSKLKWHVFEGYNYDIKSSQLVILKNEFKENNIKCKRLKKITKKNVMNLFNVSDKVAKMLIYSLIFSMGHVRITRKSEVFKGLSKYFSYKNTVKLLKKWKKYVRPIKESLNKLVDIYISNAKKRVDRGISICNAVGHTYLIKNTKVMIKVRGKILAHMIQGIESRAIYETILNNPNICGSIEHDGVVSSDPINWVHPYLKLKLKHENDYK